MVMRRINSHFLRGKISCVFRGHVRSKNFEKSVQFNDYSETIILKYNIFILYCLK